MTLRRFLLILLSLTVLSPVVLYTDRLCSFSDFLKTTDFLEDGSKLGVQRDVSRLEALSQENEANLKEPVGHIYLEKPVNSTSDSYGLDSSDSKLSSQLNSTDAGELIQESSQAEFEDHKLRLLSAANDDNQVHLVTEDNVTETMTKNGGNQNTQLNEGKNDPKSENLISHEVDEEQSLEDDFLQGALIHHLKDQLIRARVYISLGSIRSNPSLIKELRQRVKEVQRAVGDASRDTDLPRNAKDKMKAMEQTLLKAKQTQDDCSLFIKKLRAILHSTEDQLRAHRKQTIFLMQLAAKTLPKGLHCLPLRLSSDYYSLSPSEREFSSREMLDDPSLYHYAIFSDNILAAAVVVNSTVFHAKEQAKHVFHVVTDKLNYASMRMWFLANPPGKATIEVKNIEEFTWLNSSYSPVLRQLESPAIVDYYFRSQHASSDSNLKYRNPKYLSILNHLRFYLPEIFPKLNKVVFLDDDIVVQKDLTMLWALDLKGNVNGAVETCRGSFHRFDRYLNFSNPLISKNFNPHACGWAYGMNVFDLDEWRRQEVTEIYHSWQNLNRDRALWKLGTLPPGLITFWNRTFSLDKGWHVLGLGYDPNVKAKEIERAAVIHYNGNMKPWLEIGMPQYRKYWEKFLDFDQVYLRECNINP